MKFMSELFSWIYDRIILIPLTLLILLFAVILALFTNKEEMEVYHDY